MKMLLLLLPLLAHADDFNDRAHQAAQQQRANQEATRQRQIDQGNLKILQLVQKVEKANGGANATMKCFASFSDSSSWKTIQWCSGSTCVPIYSRYWPWEQKMQLGFTDNSISECSFNTNNGYACKTTYSGRDDYSKDVMCYDKRNVEYIWNGAKLVRYVAPPPTEPTPWTPCETERMHWAEAQAECDRMNDSHDRDLCRSALSNEPTCTN